MPYVEGFGTWPFGEEWLWEAIATSYLPLLDVLDAHPGKVTLSHHPGAGRPARGAGRARALPGVPARRPPRLARRSTRVDHPEVAAQIAYSSALYESAAEALERRGDLIAASRRTSRWTSAATHAVLPLLATDAGVRLQLETGIASHRRRFGTWDGGFWLPECAHAPWLDGLLEEAGVHMTCVDWSRRPGRRPGPQTTRGGHLPGPRSTATAIDRVWHEPGYPSHGDYRDTHRLTPRAHALPGQRRRALRPRARGRAGPRGRRGVRREHRRPAVVAFDTELFGHHWHEGVTFLQRVLELADVAPRRDRPRLRRPGASAAPSSWGRGRDLRTWSRGELAWTPAPRGARGAGRGAPSPRALRELLALQSSDWAFLIDQRHRRRLPARAR